MLRVRLLIPCARLTKLAIPQCLTPQSRLEANCLSLTYSCSRFVTRRSQWRKLSRLLICFCDWKGRNLPQDLRKFQRRADCQAHWWHQAKVVTVLLSPLATCKTQGRSPRLTLWTSQRTRRRGLAPPSPSPATDRPPCLPWTRSSSPCSRKSIGGRTHLTRMKTE